MTRTVAGPSNSYSHGCRRPVTKSDRTSEGRPGRYCSQRKEQRNTGLTTGMSDQAKKRKSINMGHDCGFDASIYLGHVGLHGLRLGLPTMHATQCACTRPRSLPWVVLPAGAAVILTALAVVLPSRNPNPPPLNSAPVATYRLPFEIIPDSIDFGILRLGELAHAFLTLRNTQEDSVMVQRIETSCPCIGATPMPMRIGPGRTEQLNVVFNPSFDPDFEGALSVEVTGHLASGQLAFRTSVRLEIERCDFQL